MLTTDHSYADHSYADRSYNDAADAADAADADAKRRRQTPTLTPPRQPTAHPDYKLLKHLDAANLGRSKHKRAAQGRRGRAKERERIASDPKQHMLESGVNSEPPEPFGRKSLGKE